MIILGRITPTFHNHRRLEQIGFTAGRSTTEIFFAIRQIIEKSKEFNKSTYIGFINFKAAFASVSRDSLWKVLHFFTFCSCASIVHSHPHRGTPRASSRLEEFTIETGVKQGCVIAPDLFNCVIDHLMRRLLSRCSLGIQLGEYQITDLDYADDIAICVRASRSSDDTSGISQPYGDANQLAIDQTHGHHPQSHQPSVFEDMQHGSSVCRFLHMSWILDHE